MSTRLAHRLALVAVLGILAIGALGALQPRLVVCGSLDAHYAPILAFEFARSVGDLQALFGDTPSACRAALVTGLNRVNLGDNWLFIPTYGAFLVFSLLALAARNRSRALIAVAVVVLACAFDYAENACLAALVVMPDVESAWLALLPWVTGGKWLLLGVVGTLGGSLLGTQPRTRWLAKIVCGVGLLGVVLALLQPRGFGRYASVAVGLSWVALLVNNLAGVLARSDGLAATDSQK